MKKLLYVMAIFFKYLLLFLVLVLSLIAYFFMSVFGKKPKTKKGEYDFVNLLINNYATVCKAEKYGLVDSAGTLVIPTEYDSITIFHKSLYKLKSNGKTGFYNVDNNKLTTPIYDKVELNETASQTTIIIYKDNKKGFCDAEGEEMISPIYDSFERWNNWYKVHNGDKVGVVSYGNRVIVPVEYDEVTFMSDSFIEAKRQEDTCVLYTGHPGK